MIDPVFKYESEIQDDHIRCKYPSKLCWNHRAYKRNGQLHRFCEDHRNRANKNQKRWNESRQRRWEAVIQHYAADCEPTEMNGRHIVPAVQPTVYQFTEGESPIMPWHDLHPLSHDSLPWDKTDGHDNAMQACLSEILNSLLTEDLPPSPHDFTYPPNPDLSL